MKFLRVLFLSLCCGAAACAQSGSMTASTPSLSAAGGTVTFTVTLTYPQPLSSLGFQVGTVPPAGRLAVPLGPIARV
jgi:hypothetical protein